MRELSELGTNLTNKLYSYVFENMVYSVISCNPKRMLRCLDNAYPIYKQLKSVSQNFTFF